MDDLLAVTFFSCLGAIFVLIPPFNETLLKIPLEAVLKFKSILQWDNKYVLC